MYYLIIIMVFYRNMFNIKISDSPEEQKIKGVGKRTAESISLDVEDLDERLV